MSDKVPMSFDSWGQLYVRSHDGMMPSPRAAFEGGQASMREDRDRLVAEMDCGHPHACWHEGTSELEFVDGIAVAQVAGILPHCVVCAEIETVREALRKAEARELKCCADLDEHSALIEQCRALAEEMREIKKQRGFPVAIELQLWSGKLLSLLPESASKESKGDD